MRRHFVPSLLSFCLIGVVSPLTVPAVTFAEPVFGEVFSLHQPDGARVRVRIWGDEFYRVVESLDGYTLVRDPRTGLACYARLSADGKDLVSTGLPLGSPRLNTLNLPKHVRIDQSAARARIEILSASPRGNPSASENQTLTLPGR